MNLLLNNRFAPIVFISLVASLIFIPLIGNCPLFDWDEINFAECAREMVVSGDYSQVQLNFRPFWQKPPGFIWLQAISMNIFGVNEFAARFPNALCGAITLVVIFLIGKKTNSPSFGLAWALVYAGTLLPHFYFKSGIIDPWFNLFIFLSFYQLVQHFNNPVGRNGLYTALSAGFFLGMAVLTKGPAAIVIIGAFVISFAVIKRFKGISSPKFIGVFAASLLVTGSSWFIVELMNGHSNVIKAFIDYNVQLLNTEESDHGGTYFYHIIVLLIGCFPTSLFFLLSVKRSPTDTPYQKHLKICMLLLFGVVLVIFTIVKTKIIHYSSPCYLPMTYLAVYSIFKLKNGEIKMPYWFKTAFIMLGVTVGIAFALVGFVDQLKPMIMNKNVIADDFALANLKANVHWNGWEWMLGAVFVLATIAFIFYFEKRMRQAVFYLYGFYICFIAGSIAVLAPKIEQYSQHAAIEFYKAIAGKNFYVETIGFKSYAQYFYGEKQASQNKNPDAIEFTEKALNEMESQGHSRLTSYAVCYANWMQFGKIDRPAIFVAKINDWEGMLQNPSIKKLYEKNGFVFMVRMPERVRP